MLNKIENIKHVLKAYKNDTSGATAVEYGLIAAVLSLTIIAGFKLVIDAQTNMYADLTNEFN